MARSSTTFKPGNHSPTQFKPGQRAGLRHGAYSLAKIQERYPEVEARLNRMLGENPIPNQTVDDLMRERYLFFGATHLCWQDWFRQNGGPLRANGTAKPGFQEMQQLAKTLTDLERSMGLGPLARAQVAQLMSGARRDQTEVEQRYARMRAKQALRLVDGGAE